MDSNELPAQDDATAAPQPFNDPMNKKKSTPPLAFWFLWIIGLAITVVGVGMLLTSGITNFWGFVKSMLVMLLGGLFLVGSMAVSFLANKD